MPYKREDRIVTIDFCDVTSTYVYLYVNFYIYY